jgi:hypothetical protein
LTEHLQFPIMTSIMEGLDGAILVYLCVQVDVFGISIKSRHHQSKGGYLLEAKPACCCCVWLQARAAAICHPVAEASTKWSLLSFWCHTRNPTMLLSLFSSKILLIGGCHKCLQFQKRCHGVMLCRPTTYQYISEKILQLLHAVLCKGIGLLLAETWGFGWQV